MKQITLDRGFGLLNIRKAVVRNHKVIVTHRDPSTGNYWVEDDEKNWFTGCWVSSNHVKFV